MDVKLGMEDFKEQVREGAKTGFMNGDDAARVATESFVDKDELDEAVSFVAETFDMPRHSIAQAAKHHSTDSGFDAGVDSVLEIANEERERSGKMV